MSEPAPITLTHSQVEQMGAFIEEQQAQGKSFRLQPARPPGGRFFFCGQDAAMYSE